MSANDGGFTTPGLGSAALRTIGRTVAQIDWYVDPVAGSDLIGKGTQASPYQTLEKVEGLIPTQVDHPINIHLRSGTYPLPTRGYFLRPRILSGFAKITLYADEAWDPTVFSVIGGNRTAAAATSNVVVKAAGLVVDALQDKSIRFTSGAAAGQYRTVRNNTATDIIPNEAFSPAPAPGDTYQIFSSAVQISTPATGPAAASVDYLFVGDSPVQASGLYEVSEGSGSDVDFPGLVLEGVALIVTAVFTRYLFGRCPTYLYGVEATVGSGDDYNLAFAGAVFSGYGLSSYSSKGGWGLVVNNIYYGQPSGSAFAGYINITGDLIFLDSSLNLFWGGRANSITTQGACSLRVLGDINNLIGFLVPDVICRNRSRLDLGRVDITSSVAVRTGAQLQIATTTSGAVPVTVASGAQLQAAGAVNLGGAGNDWNVTGLAAFNKSFFGAAGTFKFGTDGSLAERFS